MTTTTDCVLRLRDVSANERWHRPTATSVAAGAACLIGMHLFWGLPIMSALVPFVAVCTYADLRWSALPDALTLPALATSLGLAAVTLDLATFGFTVAATGFGSALFWLIHVLPTRRALVGGGDILYMGFVFATAGLAASHPAITSPDGFTVAASCLVTVFLGSALTLGSQAAAAIFTRGTRPSSAPCAPGFGLAAMLLPACPSLVIALS